MSVLFWHYQHFYFVGEILTTGVPPDRLPWYPWLHPFYEVGGFAVEIFFAISGFIFFWKYASAIEEHRMSGFEFAGLRFSRLYPLHLLTLLLVLVLQQVYKSHAGTYFAFLWNDFRHFMLNLFFVSFWGLQKGHSYNAPVWSVSIEIFLYAVFFFARSFGSSRRGALLIALTSLALFKTLPRMQRPMGEGLACFFLGGFVFRLHSSLPARLRVPVWTACLIVTLIPFADSYLGHPLATWVESASAGIPGPWQGRYANPLFIVFKYLFFVPCVVFLFVLAEDMFASQRWAAAGGLGDLTYSSYMWHFPIQLAAVTALDLAGVSRSVFESPLLLLAFIAIVFALGALSFRWLERPAQRWLRRKWRLGSPKPRPT